MVGQFIKDLLERVFFSVYSIPAWIGIISFILFFFPVRERKLKTFLEKYRKPYASYVFPWFIVTSVILASYAFYEEAHRQTPKPVTKQEIRTFLESINPDILKMLDAEQEAIHVFMSIPTQIEFIELSKRPDFNKFSSIKKSGAKCIGGKPETGIIKESGENGYMDGYYFYPKDALIK